MTLREAKGQKNALRRIERKQNSLNILLTDNEKVIVMQLLHRNRFDNMLQRKKNNVINKQSESTENVSKKRRSRTKTKKDPLSLINLLSVEDVKSIMKINEKVLIRKKKEKA